MPCGKDPSVEVARACMAPQQADVQHMPKMREPVLSQVGGWMLARSAAAT